MCRLRRSPAPIIIEVDEEGNAVEPGYGGGLSRADGEALGIQEEDDFRTSKRFSWLPFGRPKSSILKLKRLSGVSNASGISAISAMSTMSDMESKGSDPLGQAEATGQAPAAAPRTMSMIATISGPTDQGGAAGPRAQAQSANYSTGGSSNGRRGSATNNVQRLRSIRASKSQRYSHANLPTVPLRDLYKDIAAHDAATTNIPPPPAPPPAPAMEDVEVPDAPPAPPVDQDPLPPPPASDPEPAALEGDDGEGDDELEVLSRALVLYDFNPSDTENELTLRKGTQIDILDQDDSGWWMGRFGDDIGFFPSNFVKTIPKHRPPAPPPGAPGQ